MSDRDNQDEREPTHASPVASVKELPSTRIRNIQPLGMRVLVRVLPDEERSPGGLYLPQGVATKHQESLYGEVIEVARAMPDADEPVGANVSGIPLGAFVLVPKEAGVRVPWDGDLRLVETKEVIAIVEEIDSEEAH